MTVKDPWGPWSLSHPIETIRDMFHCVHIVASTSVTKPGDQEAPSPCLEKVGWYQVSNMAAERSAKEGGGGAWKPTHCNGVECRF